MFGGREGLVRQKFRCLDCGHQWTMRQWELDEFRLRFRKSRPDWTTTEEWYEHLRAINFGHDGHDDHD